MDGHRMSGMLDDDRCCWMKLGLVRTETGDGRFWSLSLLIIQVRQYRSLTDTCWSFRLGLVCLSKIVTWSD